MKVLKKIINLFKIKCLANNCTGHLKQAGWHDRPDGTMIYGCNVCKGKFK